jgi:hypothetical protein
MPLSALTVIRGAFLDLEEVAIGCLVPDVLNPGQDYWPEKPVPPTPDQVTKRTIENLRELISDEKHAGLRTKLTHFFSSDIVHKTESKFEINTPKSTGYFLKQPRSLFLHLCQEEETKKWIEETLRDNPIFFVVGLVTVTQAKVDSGQSHSKDYKTLAELPVSSIVSSGIADIFPNANVLDVGGAVSFGDMSRRSSSFLAPGERVIGVQYRKVHFHLFSENKVQDATLKPNQWAMFLGGDRAGSDNILEADLQDSMDLEDLEVEENAYDMILDEEELAFNDD